MIFSEKKIYLARSWIRLFWEDIHWRRRSNVKLQLVLFVADDWGDMGDPISRGIEDI